VSAPLTPPQRLAVAILREQPDGVHGWDDTFETLAARLELELGFHARVARIAAGHVVRDLLDRGVLFKWRRRAGAGWMLGVDAAYLAPPAAMPAPARRHALVSRTDAADAGVDLELPPLEFDREVG
jgi:hypothetical protein